MNQYFTNDPELAHDEHSFDFTLAGHDLHFTSDNGVFSKHTVDYGSRVLISVVATAPLEGKLLDLGCGWGPIGLSLAKANPDLQVVLSDVNERAMALAKRNAAANGIHNVKIVASSVYDNIEGTFDTIVTNPPVRAGKPIVSAMLEGAYDHLNAGGKLVVVLQKKQGAPSAKKLMAQRFGNATVVKKDKGYYILEAVR
ncbi:class I SAM-dependent methyltransferase [Lacticaseibacillus jixiensis]|uniref:class I SAM-dependent methyltransferase n=1 Tax=Lacticaseibacillus jixiensis TaxID=3231926 RepID=UPI0036F2FC39